MKAGFSDMRFADTIEEGIQILQGMVKFIVKLVSIT